MTGLIGLALYLLLGPRQSVLAVLAFGYSAIPDAMTQDTNASVLLLLAIAVGKILTTSLTISSGGSGGVFGPSMVIGGYSLLLPSLWVCTLSFILSDEQSIYSSQVESRSRSPAHQGTYVREVLAGVRVNEFLLPQRATTALHPADSLDTVLDRLEAAPHAILPVADATGRLLGVVNLEEVHQAFLEPAWKPLMCAEDLMRTDIRPLTPDDTLDRASELFVENDLLVLPVVDDLKQRRVLGTVHRHEISRAYLRRVQGPTATEEGRAL